jgi:hypothetical protein
LLPRYIKDCDGGLIRLDAQGRPFDGDLARAYSEESAEFDHSGYHLAVAIRQ